MKNISIAIDGPAGAGKSTVAKKISKELGILYLDTGAMYRAVALKAINSGIDTSDIKSLAGMVKAIKIQISYINDEQRIFLDSVDVSTQIRTPEISKGASDVAIVPEVRLKMVELQREMAKKHNVVMDGRDIGTYVLPDADYKFFLNASIEERAARRYKELIEQGVMDISIDQVLKDIEYRDRNDSSRKFAPLSKAEDAIEIDTTGMTVDMVTEKIINYIKGKK